MKECDEAHPMGRKKKPTEYLPENKEVEVSVFTSLEFDLAQKQSKKRRIMDDYDYNDPFLEPLEGENDAVDLECSLENFFVFRGGLEDDAKKVARKYNREKKRKETSSSQPEKDTKATGKTQDGAKLLDFEKTEDYVAYKPSWSKLDSRLTNLLLGLISFYDVGSSAAAESARVSLSTANMPVDHLPRSSTEPRPEEMVEYYDSLKREINRLHGEISRVVTDKESYTHEGRLFRRFKQNDFMKNLIEFHIFYTKYYVGAGETNVGVVRKRATWAVLRMFPAVCTNQTKIKQYLINEMSKRIEQLGFGTEEAARGTLILAKKRETADNSADQSSLGQSSIPEVAKEQEKKETKSEDVSEVKNTIGVADGETTDDSKKRRKEEIHNVKPRDTDGGSLEKDEAVLGECGGGGGSSFADNTPQALVGEDGAGFVIALSSENDRQKTAGEDVEGLEEDSMAVVDEKISSSSSNSSDIIVACGECPEGKVENDRGSIIEHIPSPKINSDAVANNLECFQSFTSGMTEERVSEEATTDNNNKSDSNGGEYPSIGLSTAANFSLEANKTAEAESSNPYSSGLELSKDESNESG